MQRIHAFEFNESAWCPKFLRDTVTESLGRGMRWSKQYEPVYSIFFDFCRRTGCRSMIDLCSGSGAPVAIMVNAMKQHGMTPPEFLITDLFPNLDTMRKSAESDPEHIRVAPEPIDAAHIPEKYDHDARTIFGGLHHFNPDVVGRILGDCVERQKPLFMLEPFPRRLKPAFRTMLCCLPAFFSNPFLAERDRLLKFITTYIVPLTSVVGLWDTVVSALRMHSESELMAIARSLKADYFWDYHTIPASLGRLSVVFRGIPYALDRGGKASTKR
ncbi:MAG: hypothetical protein JXA30_22415 [Deltaproteobacteria bacterium]|nr:hypothetical protein [Deltaproteobacteria bacterium]